METKKELMNNIFNKLVDRDRQIYNQLDDNNIYFSKYMIELSGNIETILKVKGALKKQKLEQKALKKLKKGAVEIYNTVRPSVYTFIFHLLLDCLIRLNYLLNSKSRIIKLTAKRLGKSVEEVEDIFETTTTEKLNIELSERTHKKFKSIDTRISNFLDSLLIHNDAVINNSLLSDQIERSKRCVTIDSSCDLKHLYREYEFIKEIMKSSIIGITSVTDLKLKYSDKEKKELKYNFSRVKNFVIEIEKEMKLQDKLYKCGKYAELILRSFIDADEEITYEAVDSYLEYLVELDRLGRLEEEYGLLGDDKL